PEARRPLLRLLGGERRLLDRLQLGARRGAAAKHLAARRAPQLLRRALRRQGLTGRHRSTAGDLHPALADQPLLPGNETRARRRAPRESGRCHRAGRRLADLSKDKRGRPLRNGRNDRHPARSGCRTLRGAPKRLPLVRRVLRPPLRHGDARTARSGGGGSSSRARGAPDFADRALSWEPKMNRALFSKAYLVPVTVAWSKRVQTSWSAAMGAAE